MSETNQPVLTVADALTRERRGLNWAKQTIQFAHENLLSAAKDIPDTEEYAELRRAIYRALDRIRQARGAMTQAVDTTTEAMLLSDRALPITLTNPRLKERYGKGGASGATQVEKARRDRANREATYAERERQRREAERQAFLQNRRGEGMADNQD